MSRFVRYHLTNFHGQTWLLRSQQSMVSHAIKPEHHFNHGVQESGRFPSRIAAVQRLRGERRADTETAAMLPVSCGGGAASNSGCFKLFLREHHAQGDKLTTLF